MKDQTYKKIFITLSGIGIILFVVFVISLTLDISLTTKNLWIGALIGFLTIFLYYTTPLYGKIITIIVSTITIYIFLSQFVGWSAEWSLISAVMTIVIIISGHFAIG